MFPGTFDKVETNDFILGNDTQEEKNATRTYIVDDNSGTISREKSDSNGTNYKFQSEEMNGTWTYINAENKSTLFEYESDYNSTYHESKLEKNDTIIERIDTNSLYQKGLYIDLKNMKFFS